MNKKDNFIKGRQGEETASRWLKGNGYRLVGRNVKNDFGEIDIIAEKDGWLVFIEVKAKYDDGLGLPEEMISRKKVARIKKAAQWLMLKNRELARKYVRCRVDAVCILMDGNKVKKINHYQNIDW